MLEVRAVAPWYCRSGSLVLSFCFIGPFMLPLLWLNPELSRKQKELWTIIVLIAGAILLWVSVRSVQSILDYYHQLDRLEQEMLGTTN